MGFSIFLINFIIGMKDICKQNLKVSRGFGASQDFSEFLEGLWGSGFLNFGARVSGFLSTKHI